MKEWKELAEELDRIAEIGIVNYQVTKFIREAASVIRKAIPEVARARQLEEKVETLARMNEELEERIAIMCEAEHAGDDPDWPPADDEC